MMLLMLLLAFFSVEGHVEMLKRRKVTETWCWHADACLSKNSEIQKFYRRIKFRESLDFTVIFRHDRASSS